MEVRVSVRSLVEFILRSGDIDNRKAVSAENAMQEGGRIHRMIQRRMGPSYRAEVSLRWVYDADSYEIVVEGRADGIITEEGRVTVDEIKGTYHDLMKMKKAVPVHLAQAKCYAFIYAGQNRLPEIGVRMTYCHMETEEIRYFEEQYSYSQLEEWFLALMDQYRKWADFRFWWRSPDRIPLERPNFPFPTGRGRRSWPPMYTRPYIIKENCL